MNDWKRWLAAAVALVALVAIGGVATFSGSGERKAGRVEGKGGKAKGAKAKARAAKAAQPDRPNVLILLWDTVRADRLSIYQPELPTTPRMAEWAKSAVVYDLAISPAMWTVPSHASMFTGLPPTTHGAGYDHRWLDGHHVTMAEWLLQHGYDTYAFSANPNLSPDRVNLLQGVEHIDLSWGRRWKRKVIRNAQKKQIRRDRSTEISPAFDDTAISNRPFTYNAAPITHEAFVGWLDRREDDDKPWFAYLSYMEAHKPRIPSVEARRRVSDDSLIEVQLQTDLSFKNQLIYSYGKMGYSERELEAIGAVYDATLTELDASTWAMLEDMKAKGYLDNTIVILTSDHGELLGEHQLFGHRHSIYQSLVHVPLVISWPGKLEPKRVGEPVSNLDLFHTVLELTELPKPDHAYSRGNLISDPNNKRGVFTEMESIDRLGWNKVSKMFPDLERGPWLRRFRGLVYGDWKVIRDTHGDCELYHLGDDPHETHDRADSEPERLAELEALLDAFVAQMPAYDATKRVGGEGEARDDAATRAQLALLGYIDEEGEDEDEVPAELDDDEQPRAKAGKAGKAGRRR